MKSISKTMKIWLLVQLIPLARCFTSPQVAPKIPTRSMVTSASAVTMLPWDSVNQGNSNNKNNIINSNEERGQDEDMTPKRYYNPTPVLWSTLLQITNNNRENNNNNNMAVSSASLVTTALAIAIISLSTLLGSPEIASAAQTGGRMGGSFRSASPTVRSAPSRSYSNGGGRGYYGGGGGYRGGFSVAPTIVTPYYSPPIITPYYGGGGLGIFRGPSFFDLLFFGGLAYIAISAITSTAEGIVSSGTDLFTDSQTSVLGKGATTGKLTVALEVPNRDDNNSILTVLDKLAQTARTDSRVGIQDLTSQVAIELLRRKSSIVSGFSQSQHYNDKSKAQREFSSTAVQERGKFEQETVSRFGGVDYSYPSATLPPNTSGNGDKATMAVVTLVYAIDGDSTKLPRIRSISDVEEALRRIASDSKVDECLQSTEILWTPQARSEVLTLRDVIADYPELTSV